MRRSWSFIGPVTAAVLFLGCAADTPSPASPSGVAEASSAAAADGSTLKVSAPVLHEPADGTLVDSLTPGLVSNDSTAHYVSGVTLSYRFQVEAPSGAVVVDEVEPAGAGAGGANRTMHLISEGAALAYEAAFRWRVRAEDAAGVGPWSSYRSFVTPVAPPTKVWPTTPDEVVAFASAEYPEYLVATAKLDEREQNMKFIRDRMIEAGICGGMDLAWNLKRGTGPRSTDALLHRDGGRDRVIDIAQGFDEHEVPMRLHWIEVEGPPGYFRFLPRPTCR